MTRKLPESSQNPADVAVANALQTAVTGGDARLRSLLEQLPAVVYIAEGGAHGRWSYVSPRIETLLGFSPQEWMASQDAWSTHLHPDDCTRVLAEDRVSTQNGQPFVSEYRLLTRDGEVVWVRDEAAVLQSVPGKPCLIQGVLLDITASKTAQMQLLKAEDRLSEIVNNAPIVVFALDNNGVFTLSEGMGLRALGLKPGEVVGRSLFELYRDYPSILANFRRALAGEEVASLVELPDLKRTYETKWTPQKDASGRVVGVTGVATDVSLREQAESALHTTKERLRLALEASGMCLWDLDVTTGDVYLSEGWSLMLGREPRETLTNVRELFAITHPDDRQRILVASLAVLKRAAPVYREEHRVRNSSGDWIWVESMGRVVARREDGRALRAIGTNLDITKRKNAEDALRQSEEKYANMIKASPDAITLRTLPDCRYIDVNESFTKLTGYTREEVLGKSIEELNILLDSQKHAQVVDNVQQRGDTQDEEFSYRTKAGEVRIGIASATRVRVGGKDCVLSVTRDVTDSKLAEEALRKSELRIQTIQKMEAVGRLAGGIAHDFNNMLMVVSGQLELLREQLTQQPDHIRKIEQAQKAAERAASLTRQLLAFSRMQALQPQIVNLTTIVSEMNKLLAPMMGPSIEMDTRLDPALGSVKADPAQIEQVILNLVVNARDAMPDGGRLSLETSNIELDEEHAGLHPPMTAGQYVQLEVSDTGIGMDAETQKRIFEPFFTTKPKGKGTGLGLASVYGIVKQSGGFIWVDSVPGHGTTFRMYLPIVAETSEEQESPKPSHKTIAGTETILLVEDEPAVRAVARAFLHGLGYKVLEAGSGAEALDIARRHPHRVDLLLTDLVMPGIAGSELAAQIALLRPDTKVAYMSGYSDFKPLQGNRHAERHTFVQKPFTRDSLARAIRQALDRRD